MTDEDEQSGRRSFGVGTRMITTWMSGERDIGASSRRGPTSRPIILGCVPSRGRASVMDSAPGWTRPEAYFAKNWRASPGIVRVRMPCLKLALMWRGDDASIRGPFRRRFVRLRAGRPQQAFRNAGVSRCPAVGTKAHRAAQVN